MDKYRIYIDEVGNADLDSSANEDHRFLCLTGVAIKLSYVRDVVQPDLEQLKRIHFNSHPDEPVIMHRKELVRRKDSFSSLKDPEKELAFNTALLTLLKKWEYTVIAVVIDKQEHLNRYAAWRHDPYHYCQEVLLERYRLFLDLKKSKGDVMIESRGGAEDTRLKKSFRLLMDGGTGNVSPSKLSEYLTSKELKVKPKAANIAGLQIADLLAHPCRRFMFKEKFDLDDHKITFADSIIALLKESKFLRYKNNIMGYGAKKLP